MASFISPRVLKGFRDILPEQQKVRQRCISDLRTVFSRFGFLPIDTPMLEYEEVLLGTAKSSHPPEKSESPSERSESEKQMYRFRDKGGRNVGLRFDLTIPFARFVATHLGSLCFPFHRYQIGSVFRGETPQRGRFREFIQCDFDSIGVDSASADATIVHIIDSAFAQLGISEKSLTIHISHRSLLHALLEKEGCSTVATQVLRVLDKSRLLPSKKIEELLLSLVPRTTTHTIMRFCESSSSNAEALKKCALLLGSPPALCRLREIESLASTCGVRVVVDMTIVRGLDYYTGFICETFHSDYSDVGSLCSGGRYDDLSLRFGTTAIPCVGASVGLDRLLSVVPPCPERNDPHVVIYSPEGSQLPLCFSYLRSLHEKRISAEVFPLSQKIKHVFRYAERTKTSFLIIVGDDEARSNTLSIKDLDSREQKNHISLGDALAWIQTKTLR